MFRLNKQVLRNVCILPQLFTASQPTRPRPDLDRSQNLKSRIGSLGFQCTCPCTDSLTLQVENPIYIFRCLGHSKETI